MVIRQGPTPLFRSSCELDTTGLLCRRMPSPMSEHVINANASVASLDNH